MQIPKDILEPIDGLSREIGLLVAGLEEVRAQTVTFIADLSKDELAYRVLPGFHQIGALALHLAETEFWWIQTVFDGLETSVDDRKQFHLNDTTESDFALKGYDASDCIRILSMAHERAVETLSGVPDGNLDILSAHPRNEPRFESSLRWILHHLIDHEATHKGQIALIKRVMRESDK